MEGYQNYTERVTDDDSSEYLLDDADLYDINFGHGPFDFKVLFTNANSAYNSYY